MAMKIIKILLNFTKLVFLLVVIFFSGWALLAITSYLIDKLSRNIPTTGTTYDPFEPWLSKFFLSQELLIGQISMIFIGLIILIYIFAKAIKSLIELMQFFFTDVTVRRSSKHFATRRPINFFELLPRIPKEKKSTIEDAAIEEKAVEKTQKEKEKIKSIEKRRPETEYIDKTELEKHQDIEKFKTIPDEEPIEHHPKVSHPSDQEVSDSYIVIKKTKAPTFKAPKQPTHGPSHRERPKTLKVSEELPKPAIKESVSKEDDFLRSLSLLSLMGIKRSYKKTSPQKNNRLDIS